jgi:hypothetical protein
LQDEKIALEQLINDRDAVNKKNEDLEKESKGGTTAFELLTQAAETFKQNAGTLVGGNQPFAGPTGSPPPPRAQAGRRCRRSGCRTSR